jgi:AAA family ATP:ADP antiporter
MNDSASGTHDAAPTIPLGPPWSWLVPALADELRALLLGWCCFFCLLASYLVLRPVRDQIGVAGGAPMLFTLGWYTVAAMLIANPCLAWLLARWPVR